MIKLVVVRLVLATAALSGLRSEAAACTAPYEPRAFEQFQASPPHPLLGQILADGKLVRKDFQAGECVKPMPAYLRDLVLASRPDIVILGEVHDNPAHHGYRSLWLDVSWKGANQRAALVFEHIRADQQPALDAFRQLDRPATAGDLFRRLDWDKSGWPNQDLFGPLFAAALAAGLPILPGEPARGKARDVARNGLDTIPPQDRARLRLDVPLPPPLAADLAKELKDNHCGMLPESAIPGLSRAQHYRDAHLADALLQASAIHGSAILLAGNGHVRTDRGVPWHLGQRAPDKRVVSVMLIEVEDGKTDPESYVPRDPDGKSAADYALFTSRAERTDPCAEMRKAYGKR